MKKLIVMAIALIATMSFPMNEAIASPRKTDVKSSKHESRTFNIGDFSEMEISMCKVEYTIVQNVEAECNTGGSLKSI